MCGRFVLMSPGRDLAKHFGLQEEPDLRPRYDIASTQVVVAIRLETRIPGSLSVNVGFPVSKTVACLADDFQRRGNCLDYASHYFRLPFPEFQVGTSLARPGIKDLTSQSPSAAVTQDTSSQNCSGDARTTSN